MAPVLPVLFQFMGVYGRLYESRSAPRFVHRISSESQLSAKILVDLSGLVHWKKVQMTAYFVGRFVGAWFPITTSMLLLSRRQRHSYAPVSGHRLPSHIRVNSTTQFGKCHRPA